MWTLKLKRVSSCCRPSACAGLVPALTAITSSGICYALILFGTSMQEEHMMMPPASGPRRPGQDPPTTAPQPAQAVTDMTAPTTAGDLSLVQKLSLQFFRAWASTKGTIEAYNEHRAVHAWMGVEPLSLHRTTHLLRCLSGASFDAVDMCPSSCVAFTGAYSNLTHCPASRDGRVCGEARFAEDGQPRS